MNVAEAVARTLVARGVEAVFGVIGSGNFLLANALRDAGATFHAARHEGGAMMMADGYGRASGRVAVCTTHQGPGFTNALTGLVEAAKARTPAILLTADTPAGTLWSNFKVDQDGLAERAGALVERVRGPGTAAEDAARALRRAVAEQRPVVLGLPIDLPAREVPPEGERVSPAPDVAPPGPDAGVVARVADLLAAAERPLIVAGRGAVVSPGARDALERLGARTGALLATSAMAHGLFAGLPYDLGIAGGFASPLCNELAAQADLVLAAGASLNRWTARHGDMFAAGAAVVQVDVDPGAPGRLHRCDVGVVADAAAAVLAVDAELARRGVRRTGSRTPDVAAAIASRRWADEPFADEGTDQHVDPRALTIALDALLPAERTVAVDSGHLTGWPAMYLRVPDERGFVFANAFQAIGLGLGAAIGAAVARPDRVCVAALGDGGALMAISELETAVRLQLPLVIVVYDDAAYGAEVHHFGPDGHAVDLTQFPDVDIAALARAAGAEGLTVRATADLEPVARWLEHRSRPLVIDAKVNPRTVGAWLEEAFRAH